MQELKELKRDPDPDISFEQQDEESTENWY